MTVLASLSINVVAVIFCAITVKSVIFFIVEFHVFFKLLHILDKGRYLKFS